MSKNENQAMTQKFREELEHDWYHDFAPLGFPTKQQSGKYALNQAAKQGILFEYIVRAIELAKSEGEGASGLELFCADGFYSHFALQQGATHMIGVDTGVGFAAGNPMHLRQARAMTTLLGHEGRAEFINKNVFDAQGSYDFILCAGGLYHLTQPITLLAKLKSMIRKALIIQTVVTMETESRDYFVSPAPRQNWGSRFTDAYLTDALNLLAYKIVDHQRNELGGNNLLKDRASSYWLCLPQ